jgi:hypothetical protein
MDFQRKKKHPKVRQARLVSKGTKEIGQTHESLLEHTKSFPEKLREKMATGRNST